MACPANSRETKIGLGFVAQTDLQTPNAQPDIKSLTITNSAPFTITPTTEDNAADIGKGDEFPTEQYPVSMDVTGRIEKFLTSESAAWAFVMGLGNVDETVVGTTGAKYVCTPTDPAVHCIDLSAFTVVEQIRPGVDAFLDNALVGCVITGFTINLESGPGRNNARIAIDIAGSGKVITPSGLTVPDPIPEHPLNAASATISVNGIDYILSKGFISAEITWQVNPRLDTGYYPGSGVDENGFALRGRMEYSNRVAGMTFVARASKGSPEYNMLLTMQEGETIVTLSGAQIGAGPDKHSISVRFPRSTIAAATNGDADGIVTINCTVKPLKDPVDGYAIFTATTETPGIEPLKHEHPAAEPLAA